MEAVGCVGFSLVGGGVDFAEEAVDAVGGGGAGEGDDVVAVAAGFSAEGGDLDGVGGVEDDGVAELAEEGEAAEVDDEVVVAEGGAALGEPEVAVAGGLGLVDDVAHVLRGHELGLLDVQRFARARGGDDEVGLSREEGGDLDHVQHLGGGGGLLRAVDVAEHTDADLALDLGEDAQALGESRAAVGGKRGAVGLVVAGLEHEIHRQPGAHVAQLAGDVQGERLAFDDAGSGDEDEGRVHGASGAVSDSSFLR